MVGVIRVEMGVGSTESVGVVLLGVGKEVIPFDHKWRVKQEAEGVWRLSDVSFNLGVRAHNLLN